MEHVIYLSGIVQNNGTSRIPEWKVKSHRMGSYGRPQGLVDYPVLE
jgi:hypothetical protein